MYFFLRKYIYSFNIRFFNKSLRRKNMLLFETLFYNLIYSWRIFLFFVNLVYLCINILVLLYVLCSLSLSLLKL